MLKAIYRAKRLDRIIPKCDRAYIAAGFTLSVICALLSAAALCIHFACAFARAYLLAACLTGAGIVLEILSLFFLIKETVRNRFYSCVLSLIFSIIICALTVTAACIVL